MSDNQTEAYYRTVFNTPEGRIVLANMLSNSGFYSNLKTTEDVAVENFMKDILRKAGALNFSNVENEVAALLNVSQRKD